jgi:hypothetical protein
MPALLLAIASFELERFAAPSSTSIERPVRQKSAYGVGVVHSQGSRPRSRQRSTTPRAQLWCNALSSIDLPSRSGRGSKSAPERVADGIGAAGELE